MQKVFLEDLPKWGEGKYKGKINWKECVGYKVNFIYEDIEGVLKIIDYNLESHYMKLQYLNKEYTIKHSSFVQAQLGNVIGKFNNGFKYEIGQIIKDNKRDLIIIDRKVMRDNCGKSRKMYKYKCNKCGFDCSSHYNKYGEAKEELWIIEDNLNKGKGCSLCCNQIVITGVNDIATTNPEIVKFFLNEIDARINTKGTNKKIIPICPDCGRVRDKAIKISDVSKYGIGCPCSNGKSFNEKFVYSMLTQLNITFETEYSPDWIKPRRYDFYIPSLNIIIETDGGWHFKDNKMSGQTKEESKTIDDYKDKLAEENGIEVVRISCFKPEITHIKNNILSSELKYKLELSNVDWDICYQYALSNVIKEVCEYWMNDKCSTKILGELFNLSISSIIDYLKRGSKIGWCDYDSRMYHNSLKKPVNVYKNDEFLGSFESAKELQRQSEELFGVKLNHTKISKVCNDKASHHKGFAFKFNTGESI